MSPRGHATSLELTQTYSTSLAPAPPPAQNPRSVLQGDVKRRGIVTTPPQFGHDATPRTCTLYRHVLFLHFDVFLVSQRIVCVNVSRVYRVCRYTLSRHIRNTIMIRSEERKKTTLAFFALCPFARIS